LPRFAKIRLRRGYTLIELIVVIAIIGSIMTLGLKLLQSLWQKQSTGVTSLEFIQVLNLGREKALAEGKRYCLTINIDKRTMELDLYDPARERITADFEQALKYDTGEKEKPKTSEPMFRSNLPADFEGFHSTSGIKLTAPVIFIHFYPDGTSDSFIVKYKNRQKPYWYIPRNAGNGVYLSDIKDIENEN